MFKIFRIHFILFSLLLAACGGSGSGDTSDPKTNHNLPSDGKPGAVTNVVAVAGDGEVVINWKAPTTGGKVTYYFIDKTIDNKNSYTIVNPKMNADSTSIIDPNALNDKSHLYRVVAANNINTGEATFSNSVMPKAITAPIILSTIPPDESFTTPTVPLTTGFNPEFFGSTMAYSPDGKFLAVSEVHSDPLIHTYAKVTIFDKLQLATVAINPWKSKQAISSSPIVNSSNTNFGNSIAFSANGFTLAIATSTAPVNGIDGAGLVEIYTNSPNGNWTLAETLSAPATVDGKLFGSTMAFSPNGYSLAISGITNGPTNTTNAGNVYIYKILQFATIAVNPWTLDQIITTNKATARQDFGIAIAFSPDGKTLAIGETRIKAADAGNVQLYTRPDTRWNYIKTITSVTANESQLFGISVAFSGDSNTLAVGETKLSSSNTTNTVQLFSKTGVSWIPSQIIKSLTPAAESGFGTLVSFSPISNMLAISDIYTDGTTINAGKVFVYDKTGTDWTNIKILQAKRPTAGNLFGTSLSFSPDGRYITVGEPLGGIVTDSFNSGLVNIYDRFKFK